MYGYYGAGYDLGEYEGDDDFGALDGVMDVLKKDVMGVPVWALGLGAVALLAFTKPGKNLLGGIMGGAKKNPRRRRKARRNVSMKANPRRRRARKNGAVKMNRRRTRRNRR